MSDLNIEAERAINGIANVVEQYRNRGDSDLALLIDSDIDTLRKFIRAAPSSSADELPPLPAGLCRDDTEHDVEYFTAEQYREGQQQAYAIGRGAAVRDYISPKGAIQAAAPDDALDVHEIIAERASACADMRNWTRFDSSMTREQIIEKLSKNAAPADAPIKDRIGNTDHVGRDLDGIPQPYVGAIVLLETIAECGARPYIGNDPTPMRETCLRFAKELKAAGRRAPAEDAREGTTAKNAAVRFDREDAREQQPDERAAFEAWAVRIVIAYHDKQRGLCFYDANLGHGSWVGWQGRATGTDRAQAGEVTPETQEILAEIFDVSERPDKMEIYFDHVSHSVTITYDDLDEEWFKELIAAQKEGD